MFSSIAFQMDSGALSGHTESEVISLKRKRWKDDQEISKVYPVIDNDLARDNVENDITNADLNEL